VFDLENVVESLDKAAFERKMRFLSHSLSLSHLSLRFPASASLSSYNSLLCFCPNSRFLLELAQILNRPSMSESTSPRSTSRLQPTLRLPYKVVKGHSIHLEVYYPSPSQIKSSSGSKGVPTVLWIHGGG